MRSPVVAILLVVGMSLGGVADEAFKQASGDSQENPAKSDLWSKVEQLGANSFATRRQAFLDLWQAGKRALPLMEQASASEDRQIAESANKLKLLLQLELSPRDAQANSQVIELLSETNLANITKLCELGYWKLAAELLDGNFALTASVQQMGDDFLVREQLNRLVDMAELQGDAELVWPVLGRLVPADIAGWIEGKLQLPPIDTFEDDPYQSAIRLFYSGRVDEAFSKSVAPQLKLQFISRGFLWSELGEPTIRLALCGGNQTAAQRAAEAVLLEYAGQFQAAQELWNQVLVPGDPDAEPFGAAENAGAIEILDELDAPARGDPAAYQQFFVALLLSGRVEPIEHHLATRSKEMAFNFYASRNAYAKAFEQLYLDAELHNLDRWLSERISEAEIGLKEQANFAPIVSLGNFASVLVGLGYPSEARAVLSELVDLAERNPRHKTTIWVEALLRWFGRDGWRAICVEAAREHFDGMSEDCQQAVLEALFPALNTNARVLLSTVPPLSADSQDYSLAAVWRWEALTNLEICNREFFGEEAAALVASWLRAAKRSLSSESRTASALEKLARLALDWDDSDLALEILATDLNERVELSQSNHHWLLAAQIHLQRGEPEKALTQLDQFEPALFNQQNIILTRMEALLMLGRYDEARQLDRSRWLRPLATDMSIAREFSDQESFERANEYAGPAFLLSTFGGRYNYWNARQFANVRAELKDYEACANARRAALLECLQPYSQMLRLFMGAEYLSILRYAAQEERLARGVALIDAGKFELARHELDVSHRLQPQDIEVVVTCFPRLVAAGEQVFADQLFDRYESEMLEQIRQWPRDATALNNLAWMYSQCDRKLEQALAMVTKAVELTPDSAVFLDTLAEVQYRLGNSDAAIDAMRRCVQMEPRDKHYRQNLVRFRQRNE